MHKFPLVGGDTGIAARIAIMPSRDRAASQKNGESATGFTASRGNGAWQSTFAVGQFLSGVLVTFLAEHVGGLPPAFIALGASSVAAAALALASQWPFASRRIPATPE
jgi:hypothetical protein